MCKHMMTDPAQMENLGWEHHLTSNGMMSVTTYRTEGAKAYFADVSAKIIVGGAPVTQDYADIIGADGYAADAASAVDVAKGLVA